MFRRGFMASLFGLVGVSSVGRAFAGSPPDDDGPQEITFRYNGVEWSKSSETLAGARRIVADCIEAFGDRAHGLYHEITPYRVVQRRGLLEYERLQAEQAAKQSRAA